MRNKSADVHQFIVAVDPSPMTSVASVAGWLELQQNECLIYCADQDYRAAFAFYSGFNVESEPSLVSTNVSASVC